MAGIDLQKRYCVEYADDSINCFQDDGFWYTTKGIIIKWSILGVFFLIFFVWFIGGYIHAKRRMRAGQPLMSYHGFLVSQPERRRYGQNRGPAQNHFTFYQPNAPYQQRQDGAWAEPPPLYNNNDAPPQYFPPPGASKVNASQTHGGGPGMEMPQYGGQQMSGVVGAGSTGPAADVEAQNAAAAQLPPRPQAAKNKLSGVLDRFRR